MGPHERTTVDGGPKIQKTTMQTRETMPGYFDWFGNLDPNQLIELGTDALGLIKSMVPDYKSGPVAHHHLISSFPLGKACL